MKSETQRRTVDLSAYPDLVVIYLGMRVRAWRGVATLLGVGPTLAQIQRDRPDGLLAHESVFFSLRHIGFRQYWRDLESMEAFTRSEPHRSWWRRFHQADQGAGIWHETYQRNGGMEAIYLDMPPIGLAAFAPSRAAEGPMKSARHRLS